MVFDFLRRAEKQPPEHKASAAGPVIAYQGSGRVAWSPRDVISLTKTGFLGNPIGFRAVTLIAEAAAALPLVLQDCDRRYEVHPVLDLIRQPNPAQGRAELFEAVYGQLLLSGNAYLEAVPGAGALPGELHVLRSDRMALVPGADGWPVAYDYTVGSRRHRFEMTAEVSPICHIRTFHPQDDHYGFSPMQAAAVAVDVHVAASRWSKALLDNAARPSGAIIYRGADGQSALTPDQYDRLVSEMEANHQGA
ncbi:MAG: phage portal protein, partial [Pseudorhodobacter sp.]|nr:phage portal protein [Pseudorhodobacter sp.]